MGEVGETFRWGAGDARFSNSSRYIDNGFATWLSESMELLSALSNPWVFQITTGLAATVLASIVLRGLGRGARQRQMLERAAQANRAVLACLRTSVAEGVLPADETVGALIRSSARRHGVELRMMWTPIGVADELVHEIMDNPFLSGEDKARLADGMAGLRLAEGQLNLGTDGEEDEPEPRGVTIVGRLVFPLISAALAIYISNALGLEPTWASVVVWIVIVVGVVGATVVLAAIVFVFVSNLAAKDEADERGNPAKVS